MKLFGRRREDVLTQLEGASDGRNVDPRLGALTGEAAGQEVEDLAQAHPVPELLTTIPSRSGPGFTDSPSYYGAPVVKEPVWIWAIPMYFHVGGLAGAASLLGAVAEGLGGPKLRPLARRCRWVGTVGDAVGSALLIYDLGRPSRFLNMLRVFRPTSPMNVGAWILAASGTANGLALVLMNGQGRLKRVGDGAALVAGVLGGPLAGYTAVLLSNTAVPVWQGARLTLPLLFTASSVASAASLLQLLPHGRAESRVLRWYGRMGKAAELWAGQRVEREAARHPEVVKPLREGVTGWLWKAAKVCTAAGLAMDLLPGPRVRRVGHVLSAVGGLAMRFALLKSGAESARNPHATFKPQREGQGAAEVLGHEVASDGRPFSFPLPVVAGQRAPAPRVAERRVEPTRPSEEPGWIASSEELAPPSPS